LGRGLNGPKNQRKNYTKTEGVPNKTFFGNQLRV